MAKVRFVAICDGTGKARKKLQANILTPKKLLYRWCLATPSASTDVCTLRRNRQKSQLCKEKNRTFKINSRFSGSKYRLAMRVFRVPWTFRLFKVRSVRCLKQMGSSDPVTGRHVSEEQVLYRSRLDDEQVVTNFTFS